MEKRNYRLKDIYDYLKQYYNLDWRLYQIKDHQIDHNAQERGIRAWDFDNKNKTTLYVVAIMYGGVRRKSVSLYVSNQRLEIYEITPYTHHYKAPKVEWQDFLSSRYNQEQML